MPMTLDLQDTLRQQAEALADAIRTTLATDPGGDHRTPWRRSGALAASIVTETVADGFIVGSTSAVAPAQERGTARNQPRPFLAPAAAAAVTSIADVLGNAAVLQIRTELGRR
jgi:hypothetical protein